MDGLTRYNSVQGFTISSRAQILTEHIFFRCKYFNNAFFSRENSLSRSSVVPPICQISILRHKKVAKFLTNLQTHLNIYEDKMVSC